MIQLSDITKEKIRLMLKDKDSNEWGMQIKYTGGHYVDLKPVELKSLSPEDSMIKIKKKKLLMDVLDFKLVLDSSTADKLEDASIDYIDGGVLRGVFEVTLKQDKNSDLDAANPQVKKIQDLLTNEINPAIATHGGFAQLLGVKDNVVYLQLGGGCQGCGMADATLKQGIEVRIKEEVPEIESVIDQTNHAGGTNPYFQPGH